MTVNSSGSVRALFVEFIGPPGAGKSTITRAVVERLNAEGFSSNDRNGLVASTVTQSFVKVATALAAAAGHSNTVEALRFARRAKLSWRAAISRGGRMIGRVKLVKALAKWCGVKVVVLEQWVLQDIWAITRKLERRVEAYELRRVLPLRQGEYESYCVVAVDVPLDVAVKRITQRRDGQSEFDRLPPEQIATELARGIGRFEELVSEISALGVRTLRINGLRPVEESVDVVVRQIIEWLRQ